MENGIESTTVAEIASATTRPVVLISPRTMNGTASGIIAPRMPALDANADVTAPTAQISRRGQERAAQSGNAVADRLHGSVTLQRGDVRHDPADEQHDAPGDLLLGSGTRCRKEQLEQHRGGEGDESDAEPEHERRDGHGDERQQRADLIDAKSDGGRRRPTSGEAPGTRVRRLAASRLVSRRPPNKR